MKISQIQFIYRYTNISAWESFLALQQLVLQVIFAGEDAKDVCRGPGGPMGFSARFKDIMQIKEGPF